MAQVVLAQRLVETYGDKVAAAADSVELVPIGTEGADGHDLSRAEVAVAGWLSEHVRFLDLVAAMPQLRWVHATTAGVEHLLDLPDDVVLTNAAGSYAPAIAEYAVWGVATLLRRFDIALDAQRAHDWNGHRDELRHGGEIHGKRVGIVGYGEIGRHVARAFGGLGAEVWATRRTPVLAVGVEPLDRWLPADALPELLPACDIVVLAASLNSSTRDLLGAEEIAALKPGAILVNIARGRLVDEDALVAALQSGHLGGAVLDVAREEPLPPESPLWSLPNVLVTPHISGDSTAAYRRAIEVLCVNLPLFVAGRLDRMANLVDRSAAR
jgi:phosphoglycerate dehydrogenase-like enzyme